VKIRAVMRTQVSTGQCQCGHKMHHMRPPHACWQNEVGTCACTQFRGIYGEPFDCNYWRGGRRIGLSVLLGAIVLLVVFAFHCWKGVMS
jgi:hypothetical protein